ncbi:MAG: dynamin family protein [Desulfobacteraceae bacterium]
MINKTTKLLNDVELAADNLVSVFQRMKEIPGMYDDACEKNIEVCRQVPRQIRSRRVKIAVVGSIKSGKSTFVNALLDEDLLKRGAGVVTSIITKLRRQECFKAEIFLKSWDEVNGEIEKALLFFPDFKSHFNQMDQDRFDLRRKHDRAVLKTISEQLCSDLSITNSGFRPEAKIIAHALEGYEFIKDFLQADPSTVEFEAKEFEQHRKFTGTDAVAFFVRDVSLGVATARLDPYTELADCQGSDSTNPLHMAQIQEYLFSASMIIYLVSSRTGLREADIRFLTTIRKMGLMDRILFVLNCDFSEHDLLDDLVQVKRRVQQELAYFKPDPEVFAFSSLYTLFCRAGQSLSRKDRNRLAQWQEEGDLVNYSDTMKSCFDERLEQILDKEGFVLVVANPIQHLTRIAAFAEKRANLYKQLIREDLAKAQETLDRLKEMHTRTRQHKSIVNNTMESAVKGLNSEISADLDQFFSKTSGSAMKKVVEFVLNYPVNFEKYDEILLTSGFHNAFYVMFQDFKKAVDTFIIDQFNPEIAGFALRQEGKIEAYFSSVFLTYNVDPISLCTDFSDIPRPEKHRGNQQVEKPETSINIESVRRILGLKLPGLLSTINYSAGIRLDSMARFGFHSITELLARLLKKKAKPAGASALRDAGLKMKKQAAHSLEAGFGHCRNYLQNDYLFVLTEAVARDFQEKIAARFQESDLEIESVQNFMDSRHEEKEAQTDTLEVIGSMVRDTSRRIDRLKVFRERQETRDMRHET